MEFFGEVETAGAKATADVEDIRVWLDVCKCCEMFDELKLCLFLRFIATDPIAMVEMFAPDRTVKRSKDVIVLDDFLFVVGTRRRERLIPLEACGHTVPTHCDCTVRASGSKQIV